MGNLKNGDVRREVNQAMDSVGTGNPQLRKKKARQEGNARFDLLCKPPIRFSKGGRKKTIPSGFCATKRGYEIGSSTTPRMDVPAISRSITRLVPQKAGGIRAKMGTRGSWFHQGGVLQGISRKVFRGKKAWSYIRAGCGRWARGEFGSLV